MEVAPEKARERREQAAKDARVERWAEDSGNAALMGCELPPNEVLAADQRITAWAKELRKAGLEGDMDVLRARAFLDLLLGKDSRPAATAAPDGGGPGPEGPDAPPSPAGRAHGAVPAGFAGRVTLTVPLTTVTGLADRPGELGGIGPVDPWLARDLANAAAQNPKTTWCVTVTDQDGHATGHGCARPEPKAHRQRPGPGPPEGPGHVHPGQPGRAARRVWHLAAAHPRTRAGPDHHPGIPDHRPLRPPAPGPRPRPRGHPQAPGPGGALHLHQPCLPQAAAWCDVDHNTPYRRPDLPL